MFCIVRETRIYNGAGDAGARETRLSQETVDSCQKSKISLSASEFPEGKT